MKCGGGGGEIGWERVRKCRPQWTSISIFGLPRQGRFFLFNRVPYCSYLFTSLQVNVKVDYIKPPSDGFPERTCATVTISGINVAEALISKGFATALRHKQDDDQRSSCYDDLLAAETRAIKNGKGLHSKKEAPIHRVADLSGVSKWI